MTAAQVKKYRERVQESADIWYEFFYGFLSSFDTDTKSPKQIASGAAILADYALEEFEQRWARKLHNECAKCGRPLEGNRGVCRNCIKDAVKKVCKKKRTSRDGSTGTRSSSSSRKTSKPDGTS
jgi:hypothetical protein